MKITRTETATDTAGILIAEYEDDGPYTVIGAFITESEALDLALDHFVNLSQDDGDAPPWAYIGHCRNSDGHYVKTLEIR